MRQLIIGVCLLLLAGCGQTIVKSTTHAPLQQVDQAVDESQLLDLGIMPFDPGLEDGDGDDPTILADVRNAESRFMATQLADTVQRSAAWGAVRVLPGKGSIVDVYVEGTILHSDGERLKLSIHVYDSSGKDWYTKEYEEIVGQYTYDKRNQLKAEPFQGIYNRISNDLLAYRKKLDAEKVGELRAISEIRFAREFSPDAFSSYIKEDKKGHITLVSLPAENDPQLQRVRRIRERDYLFIDTVQEYYDAFSRRMETPYHDWRANSYDEIITVRELKRQATNRTLAGVVAIVGGIAAVAKGNDAAQVAGVTAAGAGGLLVKSGIAKRSEVKMHEEALIEMGQSLEAAVEPHVIELEDRTITLTGNVEAQYEQWKAILSELYKAERGDI